MCTLTMGHTLHPFPRHPLQPSPYDGICVITIHLVCTLQPLLSLHGRQGPYLHRSKAELHRLKRCCLSSCTLVGTITLCYCNPNNRYNVLRTSLYCNHTVALLYLCLQCDSIPCLDVQSMHRMHAPSCTAALYMSSSESENKVLGQLLSPFIACLGI